MCYNIKQTKTAKQLEKHFNASFRDGANIEPTIYNAFDFKQTPVITNEHTNQIEMYYWGLIPNWAKEMSIRNRTLNARYETINEKPSFKNSINNRCLILVDGFFEWKWLDAKGKQKQKSEMTLPNEEAFGLAGLFSIWKNELTGALIETYTILTTEANEQMAEIHNSKKRMPIVVTQGNEMDWLIKGTVPDGTIKLKTKKEPIVQQSSFEF